MKKILYFLCFILFVSGCATTSLDKMQKKRSAANNSAGTQTSIKNPKEKATAELKTIVSGEEAGEKVESVPETEVPIKGIVFAKTDFQGVVQTSYVKLIMENLEDKAKTFQLNIGEADGVNPFTWDVKNVEPGYFYIELPEGPYRISSISIPVGTSLATEEVDLRFNVRPGAIHYVGTLKVVGTKEKIKLGGVPLIKPGFEYIVEVLDEKEEALRVFKKRYPDIQGDISTDLMILKKKIDENLPQK